jgi:hypothetical protein
MPPPTVEVPKAVAELAEFDRLSHRRALRCLAELATGDAIARARAARETHDLIDRLRRNARYFATPGNETRLLRAADALHDFASKGG